MERAIGETERRRARQRAYNEANAITPATIRKNVADIMEGAYKGDVDLGRVTATIDHALVGANLRVHLEALRKAMLKAAENLEFEEAARIRDEVRRLEAVDLAIADDPLARQSTLEQRITAATGRSSAGKPGSRTYRGKSRRKGP
jgi:excinuclease ABC subunit B